MALIIKDQERARRAYTLVEGIKKKQRDYKTTLNALGGNIIRLGLSAALAELQRREKLGGQEVLEHMAQVLKEANLPGLGDDVTAENLVKKINALNAEDYMLATREVMAHLAWFRRAVQALSKDEEAA